MILNQRLIIFACMSLMLVAGCTPQSGTSSAATSSATPGATGQTVVPGNTSTVGGNNPATNDTEDQSIKHWCQWWWSLPMGTGNAAEPARPL